MEDKLAGYLLHEDSLYGRCFGDGMDHPCGA